VAEWQWLGGSNAYRWNGVVETKRMVVKWACLEQY
jgi:hypothetical protein